MKKWENNAKMGFAIRPNIGLVNETFLLWIFES